MKTESLSLVEAAGAAFAGIPLDNMRAILAVLPDAVVVVDENHRIVSGNQRLAELFGHPLDQLVGADLGMLIPPGERPHHAARMQGLEAGERGRVMDGRPVLYGLHADGSLVPVSISIVSVELAGRRFFLGLVRSAESVHRSLTEAAGAALLDPLTQLGNRRFLVERLEAMARNERPELGLLLLDLDGFKPVNDTHGHLVGDEVLRVVAKRLRGALRESDLCTRFGGDEFVVVLPGLESRGAMALIAAKLHDVVSRPIHVAGVVVQVGVSIGCTSGRLVDVATPRLLLAQADFAMYEAKKTGRSFALFESEPGASGDKR
ncbi:MAG: diguanylate cyclase [Gammaproteobacteria bacterium]